MLEIILIVFWIIFVYKFLTMKITWLRVFIIASFVILYIYAKNVGGL